MNIGAFQAGTTTNVVPDTAVIKGTYRTVASKTRDYFKTKLEDTVRNACSTSEMQYDIRYTAVGYPPTVNGQRGVELVLSSAREIVGTEKVYLLDQPVMPGEDFAFYLERLPGAFFFVGFGEDKPGVHTAGFNFDDDIMPVAGYVLARSAIAYLNDGQTDQKAKKIASLRRFLKNPNESD